MVLDMDDFVDSIRAAEESVEPTLVAESVEPILVVEVLVEPILVVVVLGWGQRLDMEVLALHLEPNLNNVFVNNY